MVKVSTIPNIMGHFALCQHNKFFLPFPSASRTQGRLKLGRFNTLNKNRGC